MMLSLVNEICDGSTILKDVPRESVKAVLESIAQQLQVTEPGRLTDIPAHVLIGKGVPAALCVALGTKANDVTSEVEAFLWKHGPDRGLSISEIKRAVNLLVKENWISKMEKLLDLSMSQWEILREEEPQIIDRILALLETTTGASHSNSLMEAFQTIGTVVGQSEPEMIQLANRVMRDKHISTLEEYWKLPAEERRDLPIAVQLELDRLKSAEQLQSKMKSPKATTKHRTPDSGAAQTNLVESSVIPVYKDPPLLEFLTEVGKKIAHDENDCDRVRKLLTEDHWVHTLDIMRQLKDADWEEMHLAPRWQKAIRTALTDPSVLKMTLICTSTSLPLELFPSDAEFAVDSLFTLITNKDHLKEVVKSFMRLHELLTVYPSDPVKRAIRKGNAQFAKTAGHYDCVRNFLLSVGYRDYGTHYLMPILFTARVQETHSLLAERAAVLFGGQQKSLPMSSWLEDAAQTAQSIFDSIRNPPFSVTLVNTRLS